MMEYHFSLGGKRLRPRMAYLAAPKLSDSHLQNTLSRFAVAVELIHNATLIHDDIQDGDEFRRGKPALWKQFSMPQAINCGDALFFAAMQWVQASPCDLALKEKLQEWMAKESYAVINGQSQEFFLKEAFLKNPSTVTKTAYEAMVRGKTSALFVMPYVGGALIAGANDSEIDEVEIQSGELGFAFQIQDDLLDLWGSKGRDRVGTDIAEGKLSYPVVLAWSTMSEARDRLREIILLPREQTTDADISWAIRELESCGAKAHAKSDCIQLFQKLSKHSSKFAEISNSLLASVQQL
jgi:geranylgeranyl pyrophosphate synthase